MLNFAEQTGSGAVMLVWSFSLYATNFRYIICQHTHNPILSNHNFKIENEQMNVMLKSHDNDEQ